jgi:hypothetical protein
MQSTPSKRYQQLQPEDRVTLASLAQQKYTVRDMALVLGRSPSTISRELQRNAQPAGYASATAHACAQQRRKHGRSPNKLHREGVLFDVVRHFLSERWSPEQIALTLTAIFPKGHEHRVSHETGTDHPRPVVGCSACLHRNQAALALGEELGELGALDLATLDFTSLHIDDVQLEDGLGQIQTNDGQICSRLHGVASRLKVARTSTLALGCRSARPHRRPMAASFQQQRCRWADHAIFRLESALHKFWS